MNNFSELKNDRIMIMMKTKAIMMIMITFWTISLNWKMTGGTRDITKISRRYPKESTNLSQRYPQDIPKISRWYTTDIPKIYPRYLQDIPMISQRKHKDIENISQKYPQDIPRVRGRFLWLIKTLQELRMLSSVTLNFQVTKIVMNSGSQLSEL